MTEAELQEIINRSDYSASRVMAKDISELVHAVRRLREQLEAMPKPNCRCGKEGELPHPCPYQSEINNNEALCSCCDGCRHECAMDI